MKILQYLSLAFVLITGCNSKEDNTNKSLTPTLNQGKFQNVNAAKFRELIEASDGIVLDVRTVAEAQQGHIPKAIVIDIYQRDFEEKIKTLPKDKEIFVYCTVGARSQQAASIMLRNGFEKIYNLEGGIIDWARKKHPITK